MRKVTVLTLILLLLLTSISFAAVSENLLKRGMQGEEVRAAQKMLSDAGFYFGDIDGIFGSQTLSAVKDFQRYNNIPADGTIGKETLVYLKRSIKVETSRFTRSMTVTASAYSAYDPGNGHYTYRGTYLRKGLVAVDPSVIPLGTRLYIPGYGFALADDIGSAIKGNRIDLAFDTHQEAIEFGIQKIKVYFVE